MATRCPVCDRVFDADPIYAYVEAQAQPSSVARQVVAYHTVRLRFETDGCEAIGLEHRHANAT